MREIPILAIAVLLGFSHSVYSLSIGSRLPENQFFECGLRDLSCLLLIPDLKGAYTLKMSDASNIQIEGAAIWSNGAPPEILAMASHIEIKIVLVSEGVVVHEEIFSAPASANKPVLFKHGFEFGKTFNTTAVVGFKVVGPK